MTTEQSTVEENEQPETDSHLNDNDPTDESPDNSENDGEQPETDSQENNSDNQEAETVNIDGKEYTLEEIRSQMMMQSDYTKGKQELAEHRRELARLVDEMKGLSKSSKEKEISPEVQKAIDVLKQHGAVFNEDVEKRFQMYQAQQDDERQFSEELGKNPALKKHAEFIKAYGFQNPKVSWVDIFAKFSKQFGIENQKKLEKAKTKSDPMGTRNVKGTSKDTGLSDMERKFMDTLPKGFRPKKS